MYRRSTLLSVLCAGALAPFAAHGATPAERLDIKPGLWEVRTETTMRGLPPLPKEVRERIPPEERAKMEADFKADTARPEVETSRECITAEELDKPFQSANAEECEQTIVRTTRNTQEARLICTGDPPGTGTFRITSSDDETMDGTLDLVVGEGPHAMRIHAEMAGRWLGQDCGEEGEDAPDEDPVDEEPAE